MGGGGVQEVLRIPVAARGEAQAGAAALEGGQRGGQHHGQLPLVVLAADLGWRDHKRREGVAKGISARERV